MHSSKKFETVKYHSEVQLFSGGGWSELLVTLPTFATPDDREEMRENLQKIGVATRRPFCDCASDSNAIGMKVHSDDEETLEVLLTGKHALTTCVFPSE